MSEAPNPAQQTPTPYERRPAGAPVPGRAQEIVLIGVQWLALVLLLAAAMVRTGRALEDYNIPHIDASLFIIVGVICGAALGVTVRSIRILYVLALLLPVLSAIVFGAIIYVPAWQDVIIRSTNFANYAQQQALFMLLVVFVPVLVGATLGYALAGGVRNAFEREEERRAGNTSARQPWFDRSGS